MTWIYFVHVYTLCSNLFFTKEGHLLVGAHILENRMCGIHICWNPDLECASYNNEHSTISVKWKCRLGRYANENEKHLYDVADNFEHKPGNKHQPRGRLVFGRWSHPERLSDFSINDLWPFCLPPDPQLKPLRDVSWLTHHSMLLHDINPVATHFFFYSFVSNHIGLTCNHCHVQF